MKLASPFLDFVVAFCIAGGEIIMGDGVKTAYTEGKGGVLVRAKMHIEEADSKKKSGGKAVIAITELPYQTNKVSWVAPNNTAYLLLHTFSTRLVLDHFCFAGCIGGAGCQVGRCRNSDRHFRCKR